MPFDLLTISFPFSQDAQVHRENAKNGCRKNIGSHGFNGVTIGNSVNAVSVSAE